MIINDRGYTSWYVTNISTNEVVSEPHIGPTEHKLFNGDLFFLDKKNMPNSIISAVRSSDSIAGVLILKNNKTYGRYGANNKLLYKCIPDDQSLPSFLVPYEIKNMGFSKVFVNLYVTFQFKEWVDKHPVGVLSQTIGSVDVLENFYEYQLYCKGLNVSLNGFNKATSKALKVYTEDAFIQNICRNYQGIEDRTAGWSVFSIDPEGSVDFDDAFSIKTLDNGNRMLSIYISNVTIWLDVLKLWPYFSRRVSTIYLPDKKRSMLPPILADGLCSLQAKSTRFALVLDLYIDVEGEIIDTKYSNCIIRVNKNYVYEEPNLLHNPNYIFLKEVTVHLAAKYRYIPSIGDSHDLVAYLMILMNYHTAKEFIKDGNGIFRVAAIKETRVLPEGLPEDVTKFIKIWNSSSSQYVDACGGSNLAHELLDLDAYVHITSPIRRIVDLLNIIQFQKNRGLIKLSAAATEFHEKWRGDLHYINTTMRSIRRVQNDCSLLHLCRENPSALERKYEGYAFGKSELDEGRYQYTVFLPELKMTSRVILREELQEYERGEYNLFVFNNEEKFKKKIRIQRIDNK